MSASPGTGPVPENGITRRRAGGGVPRERAADRVVRPPVRRGCGGRRDDAVGPHRPAAAAAPVGRGRRPPRRRSARGRGGLWAGGRRGVPRRAGLRRRPASTCRRTRSASRASGSRTPGSTSARPTCSTCRRSGWARSTSSSRSSRSRRCRSRRAPTSWSGVRSLVAPGGTLLAIQFRASGEDDGQDGPPFPLGEGQDPLAGGRHPRPGRARGAATARCGARSSAGRRRRADRAVT